MKLSKTEYVQFKVYLEQGLKKKGVSHRKIMDWAHAHKSSRATTVVLIRLAANANLEACAWMCSHKLKLEYWEPICKKLFKEWNTKFTKTLQYKIG